MSRFNPTKLAEEPSNIHTGMTSTATGGNLDDQAKELLAALRSPEAGNGADGGAGASTGIPAGYYSAYMSYVKVGLRKLYGRKVGGRFFYPKSELADGLVKSFDALVERGVMYYESDNAAE